MSSFLGHGLAAATIYVAAKPPARPVFWAGWLIVVASAPDIDYLIPSWRLPGLTIIRITHSIIGCQVVPLLTCVVLWLAGLRGRELSLRCFQVIAAGLSHIVLDLLVGVTPAALLWPFSMQTFKLPFGILPSAGRLHWANLLLLRNTLIELGVLGPVFMMVWLMKGPSDRRRWPIVAVLMALCCACMFVAFGLRR